MKFLARLRPDKPNASGRGSTDRNQKSGRSSDGAPEAVSNPAAAADSVRKHQTAVPPKTRGRWRSRLVLLTVLLLGLLWFAVGRGQFNQAEKPQEKLAAALETGDIRGARAVYYQDMFGDTALQQVAQTEVLNSIDSILQQFSANTMTYEEADSRLTALDQSGIFIPATAREQAETELLRMNQSHQAYEMGESYYSQAAYLLAIQSYRQVVTDDAWYGDAQTQIALAQAAYREDRLKQARSLLSAGKPAQARALLEKALENLPQDAQLKAALRSVQDQADTSYRDAVLQTAEDLETQQGPLAAMSWISEAYSIIEQYKTQGTSVAGADVEQANLTADQRALQDAANDLIDRMLSEADASLGSTEAFAAKTAALLLLNQAETVVPQQSSLQTMAQKLLANLQLSLYELCSPIQTELSGTQAEEQTETATESQADQSAEPDLPETDKAELAAAVAYEQTVLLSKADLYADLRLSSEDTAAAGLDSSRQWLELLPAAADPEAAEQAKLSWPLLPLGYNWVSGQLAVRQRDTTSGADPSATETSGYTVDFSLSSGDHSLQLPLLTAGQTEDLQLALDSTAGFTLTVSLKKDGQPVTVEAAEAAGLQIYLSLDFSHDEAGFSLADSSQLLLTAAAGYKSKTADSLTALQLEDQSETWAELNRTSWPRQSGNWLQLDLQLDTQKLETLLEQLLEAADLPLSPSHLAWVPELYAGDRLIFRAGLNSWPDSQSASKTGNETADDRTDTSDQSDLTVTELQLYVPFDLLPTAALDLHWQIRLVWISNSSDLLWQSAGWLEADQLAQLGEGQYTILYQTEEAGQP